ncbi:MAG TPA: phosphatase PAP2 family protein [Solirubrobacteraceae bacterium]|nr:phosphatase PAP2 family protein [Solirubrobacteraceae bacterium]
MSRAAARLVLGLVLLVLVGCGVGELWISVVGSADLNAVRDVAAQGTTALTEVAKVVTWAGSAFVLVPLALIACMALIRAGLRREALAVALSLGGAMLIWHLVKQLVSRPRPPVEHLQAVTGSSFPSGHATQASAFWFSLVFVLPAAGASPRITRLAAGLALLIVLAVAASRVYLGVHYPSDVIAGMLLGTGWAAYVSRCLRAPEIR